MTDDVHRLNLNALQAEVVDLQSRLQFQDDVIHKLDAVVIQQSRQLEKLQQKLQMLEDQLAQIAFERSHPLHNNEEKPPHY